MTFKSIFLRSFGNYRHKETYAKIVYDEQPKKIFAVGDVHGCFDLYKALEAKLADIAASQDEAVPLFILGDFIDRGSQSAQLLDHLLHKDETNLIRIPILGNHEDMFLDFLSDPNRKSSWLSNGGIETLRSYGINSDQNALPGGKSLQQLLRACIPQEHIEFIKSLPLSIHFPKLLLSHAGASPSYSPHLQRKNDLIWSNPCQLDQSSFPVMVIHGHKPTSNSEPYVSRTRVNIDTGAYATGVLTAVEVTATLQLRFLTV